MFWEGGMGGEGRGRPTPAPNTRPPATKARSRRSSCAPTFVSSIQATSFLKLSFPTSASAFVHPLPYFRADRTSSFVFAAIVSERLCAVPASLSLFFDLDLFQM